jgi:hypothetical protein
MNYATLKQAIQDITQNYETTFVASIDQFIKIAERRIHMEANLPSSRKNATGVTVIGNRSVTLPADYITGKAIEITTAAGVVNLLPKAAEYLNEMYPVAATQAQPKFYAQYDESMLILAPTPDQIYTVGFHYMAVPTSITTAVSGTTWLGTNFDQVLLYAALLEAYVFMKGSADVMAYYKAAYDAGIDEIRNVVSTTKMNNFRG